ncbi:hypothetical protein GC194_02935 [bacterium]|nr:hypothetical protein [bacterium]
MRISIVLIAIVFSLAAYSPVQDLPLSDILSKHCEAVGADKLQSAKGIKLSGSISLGPATVPVVFYFYKGQARVEYYFDPEVPAVSVLTEDEAWKTNPWDTETREELKGNELIQLKEWATVTGILCNHQALGYTAEKSELGGDSCYVVELTRPADAATYTVYLNEETFLIDKVVKSVFTRGEYQITEIIYTNYLQSNGIQWPGTAVETFKERTVNSVVIEYFESRIKLNKNLFKKP